MSVITATRRCGDPRCDEEAVYGARFCLEHGVRLAGIRAALQADAALMAANGGAQRAHSKKRRSSVPCCCAPMCWAPRAIGERYCHECFDAGWSEEVGEG